MSLEVRWLRLSSSSVSSMLRVPRGPPWRCERAAEQAHEADEGCWGRVMRDSPTGKASRHQWVARGLTAMVTLPIVALVAVSRATGTDVLSGSLR